jgi:hypothetical protein
MTPPYPPQVIVCPNPKGCGVAKALPQLQTFTLTSGTPLYRVYDGTWGYDEHNPGSGDTRFAPIDDPHTKKRLPNMYLGETPTAALLETVFHDVHEDGSNVIYEQHLSQKLLAHVQVPVDATLGDLRDSRLSLHTPISHRCSRAKTHPSATGTHLAFQASRACPETASGGHSAVW